MPDRHDDDHALLASDTERGAVVERLSTACAEGRLTIGEFTDRSGAAHAARTRGELLALLVDLPSADIAARSPASPVRSPAAEVARRHFSVIGSISRRGRWRLGPRSTTVALVGGAEIDLSEALISERDVAVRHYSVIGRVEVIAPRGVRLEIHATSPIGGTHLDIDDTAPASPVLRLRLFSLVGGVHVHFK